MYKYLLSILALFCVSSAHACIENEASDAQNFTNCTLAAEQGDAVAQFDLGFLYDNGIGVAEDDEQAIYWYNRSAHGGDKVAQFNLATLYEMGEGVEQDYIQAYMWYYIASQKGHPESEDYLASLAEEMTTVEIQQATSRARHWLCEQKRASATH